MGLQQAHVTVLRDQLVRAAGLPVSGLPDVPSMFSAGVHTSFGEPVAVLGPCVRCETRCRIAGDGSQCRAEESTRVSVNM